MKHKTVALVLCTAGLISGCATTRHKSTTVQEASAGGLQVIGQVESLTVQPSGLTYKARIDTGATTCSISALDIEPFERDGKDWVRFRMPLPDNNEKKTDVLEYPVTRTAEIKRHGAEPQKRPAVELPVEMGIFKGRIEFTLTDRTAYEFPVLVGRNLLDGNMVVDVSESFIATEGK